jgi:hypothetical protein
MSPANEKLIAPNHAIMQQLSFDADVFGVPAFLLLGGI